MPSGAHLANGFSRLDCSRKMDAWTPKAGSGFKMLAGAHLANGFCRLDFSSKIEARAPKAGFVCQNA